MDVNDLARIAPWEWPAAAHDIIRNVLADSRASASDRLLAAELGGHVLVMDDALADVALAIVVNGSESADLRARAAIALGPALEHADVNGFDDFDDIVLTPEMFGRVRRALRTVFDDTSSPPLVRRRVLEAAVRAPEPWQADAARAGWASDDADWKLTAVFAMGHVPGFDQEIVAALHSDDPGIRAQAVAAAGNQGVEDAWPFVESVLRAGRPDKDLLLTAIEATATIRPDEASEILAEFMDSPDEDIAGAAAEAVAMAHALSADGLDDLDEDDES